MSRRGWSTSNFLRYASGVVTAVPLTIACWAKTSIINTGQRLGGLWTSGSTDALNNFRLNISSANAIVAAASNASVSGAATATGTVSADVWFHACGVFTSSTSRAAFFNGGGKGTNATSIVPSGIDRTSVGVGDGSSAANPFAPAGTGDIAEWAIWNVALTDAEVALLALAFSPLMVRPANLVGYWPLIGVTSPEINYESSAAVLSIQGSLSAAAHPRIIMPRKRHVPFIAAAGAPSFKSAWARNANSIIGAGAGP